MLMVTELSLQENENTRASLKQVRLRDFNLY